MKKEFQYLALGLLLVVIVSLLFGSSGPEPYSGTELFSKEYVYEGIDEEPAVEKKEEPKMDVPPPPPPESMQDGVEEEEKQPFVNKISDAFGNPENKKENMFGLDQAYASVQGLFKLPAAKKEKEGFEMAPAEFAGQPLIDKFAAFADVSEASHNNTCVSGGLSTSRGPLCLSPELIEILRTRGGNATSK